MLALTLSGLLVDVPANAGAMHVFRVRMLLGLLVVAAVVYLVLSQSCAPSPVGI